MTRYLSPDGAGASERVWAPRVSSRAEAASSSATARWTRLRSSAWSRWVGSSGGHRARTVSRAAASESADRSTPAPTVIARWSVRAPGCHVAGVHGGRRECDRDAPTWDLGVGAQHRSHRSGRRRSLLPGIDGLDGSGTEHHPLEQRVGGQTVGTVDPRTRDLSGSPQPRHRRGARQIGHDAAAHVVGGRSDRDPLRCGVQPHLRQRRDGSSGTGR